MPFELSEIEDGPLDAMTERGGSWAAYRNEDLGHPEVGRVVCIAFGPGRTFAEPPPKAPDSPAWGFGWRYALKASMTAEDLKAEAARRKAAPV